MSNKRKAKKPVFKATTLKEMLSSEGRGKVAILEVRHDDGCPTIKTQRDSDCTCERVDYNLVQYVGEN
jgi:hypothetical protein